jgi:hypothetical protein
MDSVSFPLGFSNLHHSRSAGHDIVRHSMRGQLFRTKSGDAILSEVAGVACGFPALAESGKLAISSGNYFR